MNLAVNKTENRQALEVTFEVLGREFGKPQDYSWQVT